MARTSDESGRLYKDIGDPLDGLNGEDSPEYDFVVGSGLDEQVEIAVGPGPWSNLGQNAAEILGDDFLLGRRLRRPKAASPARKNITGEAYRRLVSKETKRLAGSGKPTKDNVIEATKSVLATLKKNQLSVAGDFVAGDSDTLGDWLYKLNPAYWIKSSRERSLIDKEKQLWNANYKNQKRQKYQRRELEAGERTMHAAEETAKTSQESQDIENRLKEIEASVSGVGASFFSKAAKHAKSNRLLCAALHAKAKKTGTLSRSEAELLQKCRGRNSIFKKAIMKFRKPKTRSSGIGAAVKAMTDVEKKQLATIAKMAKEGNPNAQKALAAVKKAGYISGWKSDAMGSFVNTAFKVATAPITYGYRGTKAVVKAVASPWTTSSATKAANARRARLLAASKRRQAAQARMRAASAKSMEAQREYQAQAAAAQAEASAADAEAQASEMQSQAQEAEFMDAEDAYDDADVTEGDFVGDWVGTVQNPKHKKIVEAASAKTPTGVKIRSGATLYKKAKKGDVKAKLAIQKIQEKAKAGDPQALRDYNAVKAGKIALTTKGKAGKKFAHKANVEAKAKNVGAVRTRAENALGDKLGRISRKRKLNKLAHIERKAARGDRKSKAIIAACVAKAAKGDKKAATHVAAFRLAKQVRTSGKTPRERKNLVAAGKLVARARKGHKPSIQKIAVIKAASAKGQPNARRAMERLKTANSVDQALRSGKVTPMSKPTIAERQAVQKKQLSFITQRVQAGHASREQALAGAKLAKAMGNKELADKLLVRARTLRPAALPIKNAAIVAAAAQGGNPEAQAKVKDVLLRAEQGEPAAINSAGQLLAVKEISTVQNGQPMSPKVAEATEIVQRAHAGDPEAKRIVERASTSAQSGNKHGVEAAIALTAASAVLAATAARPGAKTAWNAKAKEARGYKLEGKAQGEANIELAEIYAKVQAGTATRSQAERGRQLALALGKTSIAAEISALMPPVDSSDAMTSLPDRELPTIRTVRQMLSEAFRALTMTTPDPFQNYKEGRSTRSESTALAPMTPAAPKGGKKKA